jgi:predicted O-methyltransferase YrrM
MTFSSSPILAEIEARVENVPGWTPIDQLFALFLLAYTTDAEGDFLELGSWCGRSATALAMAASLRGSTEVHCIDLFPEKNDWRKNPDGTYSLEVQTSNRSLSAYQVQTVWAEPFERDIAPVYVDHNSVLEIFNETIHRNGFSPIVKPFKGDLSQFVSNNLTSRNGYRLAFIDGDHSYEAVCKDIEIVQSMLSPGGWICFDDAFTVYEGVDRAIHDSIISKPLLFEKGIQLTRKLFVARKTTG